MLGIRLKPDEEERLERHAREVKRPKSVLVRDWIIERLERESIDAELARAAALIASNTTVSQVSEVEAATFSWLRRLDEEDGGYDWGPSGPPL